MLSLISKFMVKFENYVLNIITLFYYFFKLTILHFFGVLSKKMMEVSSVFLNKIYEFSELKFSPFFVRLTILFCKLIFSILKIIQYFLELPSLIFGFIYEVIFYLFKSLFRIYDGIVFTFVWFFNLPYKIFELLKFFFLWFIHLPKNIYTKLKYLLDVFLTTLSSILNFLKSCFLFLFKIKNLKYSDFEKLKNIDKASIYSNLSWFFKVQLGFNEEFRSELHRFLLRNEKLIKILFSLFFYRVTQISFLTNGFLED